MRTTLDISDDVLLAAKEIGRREKKTVGQAISDLARSALNAQAPVGGRASPAAKRLARLGIQALPHRGGIVSNELIDKLRDQEGV